LREEIETDQELDVTGLGGQRIIVTGGAGFIGSELVRQLLDFGATVVVIDNLVNGKRSNLEGLNVRCLKLEVSDIRNSERMADILAGADIVFHLACLGVRHSIHSPEDNHAVNASATLRLLIQSRRAGVKRFVYVSSSEVYGTARRVPMTEEHSTYPMTVYGASKLAGECYTRAFWATYRYPAVVVRPFNAYGPRSHHEGDCGEVIPKFMLRAIAGRPLIVFGDGLQTRDLTFVSDTASGILAAGLSDAAVGETFNLGTGREIAINDLAVEILGVVSANRVQMEHDTPRPGDVLRLCADIGKASKLLGFEPRVSLREGLIRLRDWYRSLNQPAEELLREETVHNWEAAGHHSV
jgi:UDP-glucose 4-epimerase